MTNRDKIFDEINTALTIYVQSLKNRSKQNLNDRAVNSEVFLSELINLVYDIRLTKEGISKPNQKAIDSHDLHNKVCAQFTVRPDKLKFDETIKKVNSINKKNLYTKLLYVVIDFDVKKRDSLIATSNYSLEQMNISDLLATINTRFTTSKKIIPIYDYINEELSIKSKTEKIISQSDRVRLTKAGRQKAKSLLKSIKEIRQIPVDIYLKEPQAKFTEIEVIIVNIEEGTYIDALRNDNEFKRGNYFFANLYDLKTDGFELHIQIAISCKVAIAADGRWQEVPSAYDIKNISSYMEALHVLKLGYIPYSKLVDIDLDGDYCDSKPVIYCIFSEGSPIEEVRYKPIQRNSSYRYYDNMGYLNKKLEAIDIL